MHSQEIIEIRRSHIINYILYLTPNLFVLCTLTIILFTVSARASQFPLLKGNNHFYSEREAREMISAIKEYTFSRLTLTEQAVAGVGGNND